MGEEEEEEEEKEEEEKRSKLTVHEPTNRATNQSFQPMHGLANQLTDHVNGYTN